jgi:hypothetical protein
MSGFNARGAGKRNNAPKAIPKRRLITTQKKWSAVLVSPVERRRQTEVEGTGAVHGNEPGTGRSNANGFDGTPKQGNPEAHQAHLHFWAVHRGGLLTGKSPKVESVHNYDY